MCQPEFVVRCNPGADEERKCPQYYDRRSLPLRSDAVHVSVTAEGEDELRGMANISTNAAASQHAPSSHAHEYSVLQYLHRETRQRPAHSVRHARAPQDAPDAEDAPDVEANAPVVIPAAGDSEHPKKNDQPHSAPLRGVAKGARKRHAKRVSHSRAPKARDAPDAEASAPAVIPAVDSDHNNKDRQSHSALSRGVGQGARKRHAKRARHSRGSKARHVQPNAPDDSKHPTQDKQPQAHLRLHGDPEWQVCAPVNTDQCCIWSMAFPGTATEWLQQ